MFSRAASGRQPPLWLCLIYFILFSLVLVVFALVVYVLTGGVLSSVSTIVLFHLLCYCLVLVSFLFAFSAAIFLFPLGFK